MAYAGKMTCFMPTFNMDFEHKIYIPFISLPCSIKAIPFADSMKWIRELCEGLQI